MTTGQSIPFAMVGAKMGGAKGALVGQSLGAVLFGVASMAAAYWVVAKLTRTWQLSRIALFWP